MNPPRLHDKPGDGKTATEVAHANQYDFTGVTGARDQVR